MVGLDAPSAIGLDPFGDLYLAESNKRRVDLLTPSGTIFSVVGGESDPSLAGNPPETAVLGAVTDVIFVPASVFGAPAGGTLFVCDHDNKRIAVTS